MSTPIRVSLLVFLIVCFCSTFGDSLKRSSTLPDLPSFQPSNISNINIVAISIFNDLPRGSNNLIMTAVDIPNPVNLEPGEPYTEIVNLKQKFAHFEREPTSPTCCSISRYDTKVDAGHQDVFWSVRDDGPYHSWDKQNWRRTTTWGPC